MNNYYIKTSMTNYMRLIFALILNFFSHNVLHGVLHYL